MLMAEKQTKITAEPGRLDIVIEREVDAPREMVFRAFTEPELYAQWLGPRGFATNIETLEARNGGSWRFTQKDSDGNEYSFHGVYHEVLPNERIIGTFEYDGLPESGHVSLERTVLEEVAGNRTRLVSTSVYLSIEDRDGMLQSGMSEGVEEGYSRLDELLDRLKVQQRGPA